jgi:Terpene cyclase DEP1
MHTYIYINRRFFRSGAIIRFVKKNIFLLLSLLGLVFPYYFIFKFYGTQNASAMQAIAQLFATPMSAAFNADLLLSLLVAWIFMIFEGKRIGMKTWWLFLPAALISLSFALPLFLYFRERHLEK